MYRKLTQVEIAASGNIAHYWAIYENPTIFALQAVTGIPGNAKSQDQRA